MRILNFYYVLLKNNMHNGKNNSMRMRDLNIRKKCLKEKDKNHMNYSI